jgi:hypothetical protein
MKKYLTIMGMFLTILISCTHIQIKDPSVQLENRASAFWKTKQDKAWDKAYGFYCKAFRSEVSKNDYIRSANLDIRSFAIKAITLSEDKKQARVSVNFDAVIQGHQFAGIKLEEEWSYEDNDWCFSPKRKSFKDLFKK